MAFDSENPGTVRTTVPVLLSFPNLKEAKRVKRNGKETGEPKFSINLEFDPGDPAQAEELKRLKGVAAGVAKAKWPGKDIKGMIDANQFKWPFSEGNKLAAKAKEKGKERAWSEGKVVLNARSQYRPTLSILDGGKIIDLEDEAAIKAHCDKHFYTGTMVLAEVTFNAYDAIDDDGKPGVNVYVNMVFAAKRGPKLTSGGRSGADAFRDYVGTVTSEDPTAGMVEDDVEW